MELQKAEEKNLSIRIRDKSIVFDEFKTTMQTVCFDIGIRQALDSHDIDSAFNFINRNFGLLNLTQIKEAFDLFSADKLKFPDPKFGHYNSFDNTFIGKVLSSYNVYISDYNFRNKHKILKPIETVLIEKPNQTKEEEAKEWFDFVKNESENKREILIADWSLLYWYMEKEGLIDLDNDEKEMFYDILKNELEHEIMTRKSEGIDYSSYKKTLDSKSMMKRECRKRLVVKHFENK
jgi:hypothetical protein